MLAERRFRGDPITDPASTMQAWSTAVSFLQALMPRL